MFAVATGKLKPKFAVRPPSPALHALMPIDVVPGSPIAVATNAMKPSGNLRPHASASVAMLPSAGMRSPSPATEELIPRAGMPGSLFPQRRK
jgi:hypothetical protein